MAHRSSEVSKNLHLNASSDQSRYGTRTNSTIEPSMMSRHGSSVVPPLALSADQNYGTNSRDVLVQRSQNFNTEQPISARLSRHTSNRQSAASVGLAKSTYQRNAGAMSVI